MGLAASSGVSCPVGNTDDPTRRREPELMRSARERARLRLPCWYAASETPRVGAGNGATDPQTDRELREDLRGAGGLLCCQSRRIEEVPISRLLQGGRFRGRRAEPRDARYRLYLPGAPGLVSRVRAGRRGSAAAGRGVRERRERRRGDSGACARPSGLRPRGAPQAADLDCGGSASRPRGSACWS